MIELKVIGLCGGSGSGKGTVAQIFNELGIPVIDADLLYHELTNEMSDCLVELVAYFGSSILVEGKLNRRVLADRVFRAGGEVDLANLNKISHKYVKKKIIELIEFYNDLNKPGVIIDAPLLFESGLNKVCDIIISVISDIDTRIARIMYRDCIDHDRALQRINSQKSDEWLSKNSDIVIENNSTISSLEEQIKKIVEQIF